MESAAFLVGCISVAGAFLPHVQMDHYREQAARLACERRQLQEDLEEERARVGRRDAELEDLDAALDARDDEIKTLNECIAEAERKRRDAEESHGDLLCVGIALIGSIAVALMVWAYYIGNSPLLAKCPRPMPVIH